MYEDIKAKFADILSYSQNVTNPKLDWLFDTWYKNKEYYIKKFNGLIYEFPQEVTFELSKTDKNNNFSDFITDIDNIRHFIRNDENTKNRLQDLIVFLEDMKNCFFTNVLDHNYTYEHTTIVKGSKIIKSFKYFIKDKEMLTNIQMAASRVIQKNKVKGKLCLSVHPLDFLSLSENTHNWRSCHALDGEYRSGNLSYMIDPSTFICYLKSDNDEVLPNFPSKVKWNSKKWRMLIHMSDNKDMAIAGRPYPFNSIFGMNFIFTDVLPMFNNEGCWSYWDNYNISKANGIYLKEKYIPYNGKLYSLNDIVSEPDMSLNYNDVLHSTCYEPMYSFFSKIITSSNLDSLLKTYESNDNDDIPFHFTIGGSVKCLQNEDEYISCSDAFRCNEDEEIYGTEPLEEFEYCKCCGARKHISKFDMNNYDFICLDCIM